ncbi:MAG: hypothetical protein KF716_27620 [Anaerolineae bacterium]|nr:hypothetical protein [Anaerolineae bacterium]
MATESSYLNLLGDMLVRLSTELANSSGPWDRQSTRVLLGLYDLLTEGQIAISHFFVNLTTFQEQDEAEWGRKAYWIHRAGKNLAELLDMLKRLTKWVEENQKALRDLAAWTPTLDQRWDKLNDNDYGYSVGENAIAHWNMIIGKYRFRLQAIRSPNPKRFPTQDTINKITDVLGSLNTQFETGHTMLRELALNLLKIENFF